MKKSKEKCSDTYNSLVSISCFYFNIEALKRDIISYPAQVVVMCETRKDWCNALLAWLLSWEVPRVSLTSWSEAFSWLHQLSPPPPPLHNVYLPTEQAETYLKICVLIYHLTFICPSLFDCEVNTFFFHLWIPNQRLHKGNSESFVQSFAIRNEAVVMITSSLYNICPQQMWLFESL